MTTEWTPQQAFKLGLTVQEPIVVVRELRVDYGSALSDKDTSEPPRTLYIYPPTDAYQLVKYINGLGITPDVAAEYLGISVAKLLQIFTGEVGFQYARAIDAIRIGIG